MRSCKRNLSDKSSAKENRQTVGANRPPLQFGGYADSSSAMRAAGVTSGIGGYRRYMGADLPDKSLANPVLSLSVDGHRIASPRLARYRPVGRLAVPVLPTCTRMVGQRTSPAPSFSHRSPSTDACATSRHGRPVVTALALPSRPGLRRLLPSSLHRQAVVWLRCRRRMLLSSSA
jgi:hypothetical protein